MKLDFVRRLILYIVDQLQDMEGQISTIRLVKILYLIDIEYYRRHKKILTEIDWYYHDFGPYFFALGDVLHSARIDLDAREVMTRSGRGYTFRTLEDQDISNLVDFATEQQINRIIKEWALEDTPAILDFVYNTPPIKRGLRGSKLDFNLLFESDRKISNPAAFRLMLASESTLAKEWDTPEEDKAWDYLSKKAK